MAGFNIAYDRPSFYIGLTGVYTVFNRPLKPVRDYQLHDPRGREFFPLGMDYRRDLHRLSFIGETAESGNGASCTLSKVRTMAAALVRLQKAVDTLRPDIIFFTMPLGALLLPLVRTKARKIYESHSARSFTPYNRLFLPMELCAEAVVCLTEDDAREYRRARKTVVIPDFIDPPAARAADYGVKRAVAVGRLERVKGFDRLITCWGEALKENPGWRLDI